MSPVMRMGMRDSSAGRMERYDMENQDEPTTRSVMMRDAEDVPGELSEDEVSVTGKYFEDHFLNYDEIFELR
jgi:hypothetical protein